MSMTPKIRFKMHRQRHSFPDSTTKPSKLLILVALLVVCLLPYLLIKTFFGKKNNGTLQVALALPEVHATQSPTTVAVAKEPKPVEKIQPV
jgi:hypothetical protein